MNYTRSPMQIATGITLIAAPLLGVAFKMLTAGWALVFLMFGPVIILVAGYVVQVVIASQGFLASSDLFGVARPRATAAAWITSVSVVAVGVFFPDGTDAAYGSTFQKWLGAYGPNAQVVHAATDAWSDWIGIVFAAAWVISYIWLFVEWILALRVRKSAR